VLLEQPLTIVTGKGGVGRSAIAAAIGRAHSTPSTRTLALSMGDGHGLASHLGLDHIEHEPSDAGGGLWGAAIDPTAALEEYVRLRLGPVPTVIAGRIFGGLSHTVPGIRDIVLMGKCVHDALRSDWDAVIVDAVPTGQIESVLAAPSTIADLVQRGPVHEQAIWLDDTLRDHTLTGFAVVATPSTLAVTEAHVFIERTASLGLAQPVTRLLNQCLADPQFVDVPEVPGARRDAALLTLGLIERQASALRDLAGPRCLPRVFGARHPTDVTAALVEALTS
jgi:anion-transporting  ArsA/GET3 family ATPase